MGILTVRLAQLGLPVVANATVTVWKRLNVVGAAAVADTTQSAETNISGIATLTLTATLPTEIYEVRIVIDGDVVFASVFQMPTGNAYLDDITAANSASQNGGPANIENTGAGVGIYKGLSGNNAQLRSLVAGPNITITSTTGDDLVITGGDGSAAAAAAVTAHNAATDPHTQYTTQTEAAAAAPVQSVSGRTGAVVLAAPDIAQDASNRFVSDTEKATWNAKEPAVAAGTSAQYYRGDKTFQALNKAAVGLGNVDDTSDVNKPVSTATATADNLRLTYADAFADVVLSGLVFPTSANLTSTMTAGVAEVIGTRVVVPATAYTFTASQDTYVDLSNAGVLTYLPVALNAAAPAVTANSLRLQKVVTSATAITSVVQLASTQLTATRTIAVPAPTAGEHATTKTYVDAAINSGGNWVEFVADPSVTSYVYNAAALTGKRFLRTEDATLNLFRLTGTPADGFEIIVRVDTSAGPSIEFKIESSTATIDGSTATTNGKMFAIPNSMLSLVYDASSNDWNTSFIGGKAGWRINNGQATVNLNLDRATFGDSGSYVTGSVDTKLSVLSTSDVAIGSDYILQGISWIDFASGITVLTPRGNLQGGNRYLKFGNNVGVVRIIRKSSAIFYVEGNFDYDFEIKNIEVYSSASTSLSLGTAGGAIDRAFLTLTGNAGFTTLTGYNKGSAYLNFEQIFTIYVMQDATGGRTLDFPASVKWLGEKGTLSVAPNALDIITLRTKDAGTTWYATIQKSEEAANSKLKFSNVFADFVVSGLLTPTSGGLAADLAAGSAYVSGTLIARGTVGKTYTASKDTYVDIDTSGTLTYVEVANAAAAPAVTANSLRLQKVVTSATAITSVVQLASTQLTAIRTLSVPNATVAGNAINKGQADGLYAAIPTQTNVTASRALNTTYTAGARPIMVNATVRCVVTVAAGSATVQGKSDGATPPTTIASGIVGLQSGLLNEDNTFQITFTVAAGANYRIDSAVTNGAVTLGSWFEVTL